MNLKGKVALVTGASRGIGRAIALSLGEAGCDVIVNYASSEGAAREVVDGVIAHGSRAKAIRADVADMAAVEGMVAEAHREFGQIHILVNNAGINRDRTFLKLTRAEWDDVIRTNLGGPFNTAHALIPSMCEAGFGRIINITSIVGQMGNYGQTNYAAAKGGIISFTKSLAREVARKGITVNCVAPGYINTDMMKGVPDRVIEQVRSITPLARLGEPEEIAWAVRFLADPRASYITGQVVAVNGGMYM